MTTKSRIYRVTWTKGTDGEDLLVRATSQAQALRYVAQQHFSVRVASQDDILTVASGGYAVVDATALPDEE